MKPVQQRNRHNPKHGVYGDCHRAAYASILELEIDQVPHFMDRGIPSEEAQAAEREWLFARGLMPINVAWPGSTSLDEVLNLIEVLTPGAVFILGGQSKNRTNHSVVAGQRKILHDPSIDQSGIEGPMDDGMWWVTFIGSSIGRAAG